jgi:ATP synthase F0 subunit c
MGYLVGQTIASIHRQPEALEQTRTLMFLGIGLVEAFALYGIVSALLIAFVLKERATFSPLRRRFRDPVVLPGQKLDERVMPVLMHGCRFSSKIQDWRKLWRIEPGARTRRVR